MSSIKDKVIKDLVKAGQGLVDAMKGSGVSVSQMEKALKLAHLVGIEDSAWMTVSEFEKSPVNGAVRIFVKLDGRRHLYAWYHNGSFYNTPGHLREFKKENILFVEPDCAIPIKTTITAKDLCKPIPGLYVEVD
ncbi:MAG: hypothetical protein OQJ80_05475 [Kangiella sp.]|nr:hypothetical protein [Kangiella sp.]